MTSTLQRSFHDQKIGKITPNEYINKNYLNQNIIQSLTLSGKLEGHDGCVNAINFSECGNFIVTGSDDETVKIWNTWTGNCLHTFGGHVSNVFATNFLFGRNNQEVISGGNDADIRLYDITKGVCTVYGYHTKKVLKFAYSNQLPNCFYSCSADGTTRLYDVRCKYNNTKVERISVKNSNNNNHHYSIYDDDSIIPQAAGGGRRRRSTTNTTSLFQPPTTTSTSSSSSNATNNTNNNNDEKDSLIVNYKTISSRKVPTLYSIEVNPLNSFQIIIGSYLGDVRLFDTRKIEEHSLNSYVNIYRNTSKDFDPLDNEVTGVAFSHDGSEILATHLGDSIYLFDTLKNYEEDEGIDYSTIKARTERSNNDDMMMLEEEEEDIIDNDDEEEEETMNDFIRELMEEEDSNEEEIREEEGRQEPTESTFLLNNNNNNTTTTNNNNNNNATTTTTERTTSTTTLETYKHKFTGHLSRQTIKGISFFGNYSEYVLSGSDDANIFIWEKATGKLVRVLKGHEEIVNTVVAHPQFPLICSGGIDSYVNIWKPNLDLTTSDDWDELMEKRRREMEEIIVRNSEDDLDDIPAIPEHLLGMILRFLASNRGRAGVSRFLGDDDDED